MMRYPVTPTSSVDGPHVRSAPPCVAVATSPAGSVGGSTSVCAPSTTLTVADPGDTEAAVMEVDPSLNVEPCGSVELSQPPEPGVASRSSDCSWYGVSRSQWIEMPFTIAEFERKVSKLPLL